MSLIWGKKANGQLVSQMPGEKILGGQWSTCHMVPNIS